MYKNFITGVLHFMNFEVIRQTIRRTDSAPIIADSINYLTAKFRFSSDWADLEKHVTFTLGANVYDKTLDEDDEIKADQGLNLTVGTWTIGIVGVEMVEGEMVERITADTVSILVTMAGSLGGEAFPEISGAFGEIILQSEADRVVAEAARVAAEEDREAFYAAAQTGFDEEARVTAEGLRVEAESARETAEGLREDWYQDAQTGFDEDARVSAENLRIEAESARDIAEGLRDSAEQGRDSAEGLRVVAEQGRGTAEGLRVTAESGRDSAEGLRDTAEQGRDTAEGLRDTAEGLRDTAEGLRDSAEDSRIAAESARAFYATYDAATSYILGNKVSYNGSSYIWVDDDPSVAGTQPPNTGWLLIASRGEDGIDGTSGVYVGSDPIPEGYNVQIDPDGDATDVVLQFSTMPTADADYLGVTILYTGATGTYKNGGTYICVVSEDVIPVYSWSRVGEDISGAISTHNTDAGAHADKESKSNKVTSLSSESTDTQYPSAKSVYDFGIIIRDGRVYTLRWDKVNARGVRLNNAQGISTTITNFCHRGTVNAAMDNPFDSIYPWSEINLCNISIDEYRSLAPGSDIRDCAVSWLGDVDFSYGHENGVYVFRPEHFTRVIDDGPYRYIDISNKEIPGSVKQKARMEGRYFGAPYALTIDGVSKTCLIPKPGMPGKNIAMSTLHTYAKNWGATLENIYGYSDVNALMAVEYATLNSQDAVGSGVSDLYRQNGYTIKAAASNTAVVKILTADASTYCIAGAVFDIGATDGGSSVGPFIIASTALDTDPTYTNVTLTTDGTTPASVTVTTAHYWSVHGLYNAIDSAIGAVSGYIGTNGRCNAYYRGQIAHANMFRYVLGAYRKSGNGGIWIANSEAEADAYDALNQGVHHDTGLTLPQGAGGAAASGYIQTLGLHDGLLAPLCTAIGGGSINPVGDYCSAPSLATGDTVLIAGGHASCGTVCGRFCGYWSDSAAASYWLYAAVPVLKSPCVMED